MANTISHSFAALTREILSLPLEHKIHIFSPPCNILYVTYILRDISPCDVVEAISGGDWNFPWSDAAKGSRAAGKKLQPLGLTHKLGLLCKWNTSNRSPISTPVFYNLFSNHFVITF